MGQLMTFPRTPVLRDHKPVPTNGTGLLQHGAIGLRTLSLDLDQQGRDRPRAFM